MTRPGAHYGWDSSVPEPPDFFDAGSRIRLAMLDSSEWGAWAAAVPKDIQAIIWVHDRNNIRLSPLRRRFESRYTGLLVPPSEFLRDNESTSEAWARIYHELWCRAAKRYGWPEPPAPVAVEHELG